jgi:Flp pilus assembly protein TadG
MRRRDRTRRALRRERNAVSRGLRDERGAAMIEFALIATALFILIFGILYLGRYINYQLDETHLANEAARYAAVGQLPTGCTSTLASCIASQANGELLGGSSDVTQASVCVFNDASGSGNIGDAVDVTVTSNYSFLPILGIATITDKERASMRLETSSASTAGILSQAGPSPSCS